MNALVGLLLIVMIFFTVKEHRKISMNNYRDELFQIRHKLFMLPIKYHEIEYESQCYRHYERTINNHIRYAHKASFLELLIVSYHLKKEKVVLKKDREKEMLEYLNNDHLIEGIKDIEIKMRDALLKYFLKTSPLIYVYFMVEGLKIYNGNLKLKVDEKLYDTVNVISSDEERSLNIKTA